jgi:SagB-type dehydrogenase family enzyme
MTSSPQRIPLPEPAPTSGTSIEEALRTRRSVRDFPPIPLKLAEVSQLLWAAQGITNPQGLRAAPSAGALYPLEVYLVAGDVDNLAAGVYKYEPRRHELRLVIVGDKRTDLYRAALQQETIRDAPAALVFGAVYERTTQKYSERGRQYVHMEVGHAAQNVVLQAVSLKLGTVVMGAFNEERVREALSMTDEVVPLYIMPIGRRQK